MTEIHKDLRQCIKDTYLVPFFEDKPEILEKYPNIANDVELSIYNKTLEILEKIVNRDLKIINNTYKNVFMSVCYNLEYIEDILKNNVDLKNIANVHRELICPKKWDDLYTKRNDISVPKKRGAHKCPRCYSSYTSYEERQTRSADESATIKVYCTECHHTWKIN